MENWHSIGTAPTGENDLFLVCGAHDPRSPFVVRGSIFKTARQHPVEHHLSMAWLTHWMPLPEKPLTLQKRPVAFRYTDGTDKWVYTEDEGEAQKALDSGRDAQGLYAREGA
jgi:hypothetical protein